VTTTLILAVVLLLTLALAIKTSRSDTRALIICVTSTCVSVLFLALTILAADHYVDLHVPPRLLFGLSCLAIVVGWGYAGRRLKRLGLSRNAPRGSLRASKRSGGEHGR